MSKGNSYLYILQVLQLGSGLHRGRSIAQQIFHAQRGLRCCTSKDVLGKISQPRKGQFFQSQLLLCLIFSHSANYGGPLSNRRSFFSEVIQTNEFKLLPSETGLDKDFTFCDQNKSWKFLCENRSKKGSVFDRSWYVMNWTYFED